MVIYAVQKFMRFPLKPKCVIYAVDIYAIITTKLFVKIQN